MDGKQVGDRKKVTALQNKFCSFNVLFPHRAWLIDNAFEIGERKAAIFFGLFPSFGYLAFIYFIHLPDPIIMTKEKNIKKESPKKAAVLNLKEKRAAKKAKKNGGSSPIIPKGN